MEHALSEVQINKIFDVLKLRGIRYIDVQHELVDHIATIIEEHSSKNSNKSFDEKLKIALSTFPKNFQKLVRNKEKTMHRYWRKKTLDFVKTYFRFPKILISLGLFLAIYSGTILNGKMVIISCLLLLIPIIFYTLYFYYKKIGFDRKSEQEYLVLRMFMSNTISLIFIPICLTNLVTYSMEYQPQLINWNLAFLVLAVVITMIWCHACVTEFPDMLKREIDHKYPYLKVLN